MQKHTLLKRETFDYFVKTGEVIEVRALGLHGANPLWGKDYAKGTVAGYFDDPEKFRQAVAALDKLKHAGIYFTLQVIDPRLIARAFNRLGVLKETTSDRDVIFYRWLPIDLDPVRPAGIPSSDTELAAALKLRDEIADPIQAQYKFPLSPIKAVSGNGGHLLYPIIPELPAQQYAETIKKIIQEISEKYSTPAVSIDSKVFNPARIWKCYGTTARKGDAVPAGPGREARPHRLSFIDSVPQGVRP
jgi:hypothetical protein